MLREGADDVAELLEGGALSARTDEVACCLNSLCPFLQTTLPQLNHPDTAW